MKINLTNAVVAAAGSFFVVGAIAQKPQVKNLGLGGAFVMCWVQRQKHRKVLNSVNNNLNKLQEIPIQVAGISQSLEDTNRQINNINPTIIEKKLNKAIDRVDKLEKQSNSQQKQQNQIRSGIDKLKHELKNWQKSDRQAESFKKNCDREKRSNKITARLIEQQPTTHVYIDGNNLKCSAYQADLSIDYQALKSYLMPENGKIRLNFYNGACQTSKELHFYLNRLGYMVKALPKRTHSDGTHKTVGDDISMAIDILDRVKSGDRLILISGDGDFFPVVEKMQQRWVEVTAIASSTSVSKILQQKVDEFISLEQLKKVITKKGSQKDSGKSLKTSLRSSPTYLSNNRRFKVCGAKGECLYDRKNQRCMICTKRAS